MLEAQLEEPLSAEGQSSGSPTRPRPVRAAEDEIVRIAILGKPNTGKSSLANRLIGEERSIVSAVPGTTRDVVEGTFTHRGRTFQVLDTAGIRRKSRVTDPVEYYSVNRAIESIGRADMVFLTIDATEGLVDQDKKIAAQAVKEGQGRRHRAWQMGSAEGHRHGSCEDGEGARAVPVSRARLRADRPGVRADRVTACVPFWTRPWRSGTSCTAGWGRGG